MHRANQFPFSLQALVQRRVLQLSLGVLASCLSILTPDAFSYEETRHASFTKVSLEQGLAGSLVSGITQDQDGFMWFASDGGLNRFDGNRLRWFGFDPEQSNRNLGINRLLSLAVDSSNRIWIGTEFLASYDPETGTIARYPVSDEKGIFSIIPTKRETLWIGGWDFGIREIDCKTGAVIKDPRFPHSVYDLKEDQAGNLWLATALGIFRFNEITGTFHKIIGPKISLLPNVGSIAVAASNKVWVAAREGLFTIEDDQLKSFDSADLPFRDIEAAFIDSRNNLWLASPNRGLARLGLNDLSVVFFPASQVGKDQLPPGAATTFFEDDTGGLWFSVNEHGVYRFDQDNQNFKNYFSSPNDPYELGFPVVSAFTEVGDVLWVGTDGGGLYEKPIGSSGFKKLKNLSNDPKSKAKESILALVTGDDGDVWAGRWNGGLSRINPRNMDTKSYTSDGDSGLQGDNIFKLFLATSGKLWVSTWELGVQVFDPASEKVVQTLNGGKVPSGLRNVSVMDFAETKDGRIWIGGYDGLESFNPATQKIVRYPMGSRGGDGTSSKMVFSLQADAHRNLLWIGTDSGLNCLDLNTEEFHYITRVDGLPDNRILGLLIDAEHCLWLSTKKRLACYVPEEKRFTVYDESDGLKISEFVRLAYFRGQTNLCFGGIDGFTEFDPKRVKQMAERVAPRIELTEFHLQGEPIIPGPNSILPVPLHNTKEITLQPNDDNFSIHFAALDYVNPTSIRYRYRLEGLSERWFEAPQNQSVASYTSLAPGNYVFHVQSFSGHGSPGQWPETSVKITVLPKFFETLWFKLVGFSLLGLTMWLLYKYRLSALRRKLTMARLEKETKMFQRKNEQLFKLNGELKRLSKEKEDLMGIVAHDLRNPLSAIMMSADFLGEVQAEMNHEEIDKLCRGISEMSHRMNQIIGNTLNQIIEEETTSNSQEAPLENTLLRPIIMAVIQRFKIEAKNKHISLKMRWSLPKDAMIQADETMLWQMVSNLVSNALKYSPSNTTTIVDISLHNNSVWIRIIDEGLGMNETDLQNAFTKFGTLSARPTAGEESVGLGLYNVKVMCEQMGAKFFIESEGKDKGTTASLEFRSVRPENVSSGQ